MCPYGNKAPRPESGRGALTCAGRDPRWPRQRPSASSACVAAVWLSRLELLVPPPDLGPVHDVPPCLDVVGAAVLVLEVVRVLPHVETHHRLPSFHQRVVLVRRA